MCARRCSSSSVRSRSRWVAAGYFSKIEIFYWSAYSFALSLVILLVVVALVEARILRIIDRVHERVSGGKPADG